MSIIALCWENLRDVDQERKRGELKKNQRSKKVVFLMDTMWARYNVRK